VVADLTFVRHLINIELILNCLAGWQVHEVGGMLKGLEYKLKSESSLFRKIMSGEKTALFAPFIYKMHYFTKTGSGRT